MPPHKFDHKFIKSAIAISVDDVGWCFGLVLRKFSGNESFSSSEWFMVSFESDEPVQI